MVGSNTMRLHDTLDETEVDHDQPDVASSRADNGPPAGEAGPPYAIGTIHALERTTRVPEYVVRVQCSRVTLFAFVLDGDQRFISFDEKPRMVTHDDALEIQGRLPAGDGQPAVSIEKFELRKM